MQHLAKLALLGVLTAVPAHAGPIVYSFTGTVTRVDATFNPDPALLALKVGDPFSGSFYYEFTDDLVATSGGNILSDGTSLIAGYSVDLPGIHLQNGSVWNQRYWMSPTDGSFGFGDYGPRQTIGNSFVDLVSLTLHFLPGALPADGLLPPTLDPTLFTGGWFHFDSRAGNNGVSGSIDTFEASPVGQVVISQVYAEEGSFSGGYERDFVELFNRGTTTVNVSGWVVSFKQYSSELWSDTSIFGSIPPGGYYLVAFRSGFSGAPLPAHNASGSTDIETSGAVAIFNHLLLPVDGVGYGIAPPDYEGTPYFGSLSSGDALYRNGNGCQDTDNNALDFRRSAPSPFNSSSPHNLCSSTPPPCTYGMSPTSLSADSSGGTATLFVATPAGCAWQTTSNAPWASLSGQSGFGNGSVSIAVSSNPSPTARSAIITVAGVQVTVTQAGLPTCGYSISPISLHASASGQSGTFALATSAACPWTATSGAPWLLVSPPSSTGPRSVTYTVMTNPTGSSRTASITINGVAFTVTQAGAQPTVDADGDGLVDTWETTFGLNATSPSGGDGANGDPDGDGRSNAQEQAAGTHPRGFHTRYLAEGATGTFLDTSVALLNPGTAPASVLLRFLKDDGATVTQQVPVPAGARRTMRPAALTGLASANFSTVIESDALVVVDRTMTWGDGYGSHAETALTSPSTTWYLAEGSTSGEFNLFYLLQNPNGIAVQATVRYLLPSGQPPVEKTYTLLPNSRTTIYVDAEGPALASTDLSAVITADAPIIAERAMYVNKPGQPFAAGHESAGVTPRR